MPDYTKRDLREGRDRLKRWSAKLRKQIKIGDGQSGLQPTSHMGGSVLQLIKTKNLDAIVVYENRHGWYADVVLKGLPTGIPNVMGTPTSEPLATRDEAEKSAVQLLKTILRTAMENDIAHHDIKRVDMRPFQLHNVTFDIPGEVVDKAKQIWDEIGSTGALGTAEDAQDRLKMNLADISGGDHFDEDAWNAASDDQRSNVLANMATLLVFGIAKHPDSIHPDDVPAP